VGVQALVDVDAAARDDEKLTYLFLADAATMTDDEQPVLASTCPRSLVVGSGVPPRWYADVFDNLAIAHMGFAEFVSAADGFGAYRGFAGE
jgi:hypothetical protein